MISVLELTTVTGFQLRPSKVGNVVGQQMAVEELLATVPISIPSTALKAQVQHHFKPLQRVLSFNVFA